MGTVTKGVDARMADRPSILTLSFKSSGNLALNHQRQSDRKSKTNKSSAVADKRRHGCVRLFVICSTVMIVS